jgi:hypothetical protein
MPQHLPKQHVIGTRLLTLNPPLTLTHNEEQPLESGPNTDSEP